MKKLSSFAVTGCILVIHCSGLAALASGPKKSPFDAIIEQLITEVDLQMEDRAQEAAALKTLYDKFTKIEQDDLNRNLSDARAAAVQREAVVTADEMIRDPQGNARASALAAYLRRTVVRDQELLDQYVKKSEAVRFTYERQLAKIKTEQTILKNIRKDLESLKKYPTNKERMQFYLESVKSFLNGLGKISKT